MKFDYLCDNCGYESDEVDEFVFFGDEYCLCERCARQGRMISD